MNNIYAKLDKIVCFSMAGLLLVSSNLFIAKSYNYKLLIEQKKNALNAEIKDETKVSEKENLFLDIEGKASLDLLAIKRNIFVPFENDEKRVAIDNPVLVLLDILYKPLGFQYQGRIIYPNGQLVAQINANNKSYLVKLGENVANYKVEHLDKDSIVLKSKKGEFLDIKYLKTAFSDELMAKIKDNISGNIETVYKNSTIYGYKVLDIDKDFVILSKLGQHLRLQKGMVQTQ
ncbi:MAG: hypothetical protein KKD05_10970 [Candidatus Omnitrophica bacterium]|nr:hypothetical protein [Candidatus Omnitrophota bacterium]